MYFGVDENVLNILWRHVFRLKCCLQTLILFRIILNMKKKIIIIKNILSMQDERCLPGFSIHTHTLHTHTLSLSLSHTHTLSLSLSLSHTHTHNTLHTHSLSPTHTQTHTHTLHRHTHSLSLSHTHTLSLSLTHTHSLSLSHTHTYICIGFSAYIIMILFTNPSARAGYNTRSIFKRSLTGLNSEFSFS